MPSPSPPVRRRGLRQRTILANAVRTRLAEFGIIARQGIHRVEKLVTRVSRLSGSSHRARGVDDDRKRLSEQVCPALLVRANSSASPSAIRNRRGVDPWLSGASPPKVVVLEV
jgi:hypothetical protein